MKDAIHDATYHHVKNNRHHPECWDENIKSNPINKDNRDTPSGVIVDATKMPVTAIIEMCADWCAMSEELGGHPAKWAKDNIGVRWNFDKHQIEYINHLIEVMWSNDEL